MLVRNKVRSMRSGEVLLVRATDPTTERDLNHFCQFLGHEMLEMTQQEGVFVFWILKAAQCMLARSLMYSIAVLATGT
ncbi:MAG: sulfurtransferase TusA family protein [Pseudomonadota bacterium]|nr:sulfurtransferase TusA family protein [Pseudomonadota bacterium]